MAQPCGQPLPVALFSVGTFDKDRRLSGATPDRKGIPRVDGMPDGSQLSAPSKTFCAIFARLSARGCVRQQAYYPRH